VDVRSGLSMDKQFECHCLHAYHLDRRFRSLVQFLFIFRLTDGCRITTINGRRFNRHGTAAEIGTHRNKKKQAQKESEVNVRQNVIRFMRCTLSL